MITVVLHRQCVQHYPVHVLCTCNITHTVYIHTGIQCHSIVSGYTVSPSDQQLRVLLAIVQTASSVPQPLLWPRFSS